MDIAITHPVLDRIKPSFVIFDIRGTLTLSPERQSAPDVKNYIWRLNPDCQRMRYSYIHVSTVVTKGLICCCYYRYLIFRRHREQATLPVCHVPALCSNGTRYRHDFCCTWQPHVSPRSY